MQVKPILGRAAQQPSQSLLSALSSALLQEVPRWAIQGASWGHCHEEEPKLWSKNCLGSNPKTKIY